MEVIGINVQTKSDGLQVWDDSKPFYMVNRTSVKTAKQNFLKQVKKVKLAYVREQHAQVEYQAWCKTEEAQLR